MSGFISARPVWAEGREKEMNCRIIFRAEVPRADRAVVKVATSGTYQLRVNGEFVCYGPARAGRDHFRMDETDVSGRLTDGMNEIAVEVAGYNVNSFAIQNQSSFVQAEVVFGDTVAAYTGRDFRAFINPYYYRKIQRYSYQRPMTEAYHVDALGKKGLEVKVAETGAKTVIARYAPYPEYERIAARPVSDGRVSYDESRPLFADRSLVNVGDGLLGFTRDELEVTPTDDASKMVFTPSESTGGGIGKDRFRVYAFDRVSSGFVTLRCRCTRDTRMYVLFDEVLEDGFVDFGRLDCANVILLDLCEGEHSVELFEVYTMKYLQLVVTDGGAEDVAVGMTEYKHPPVKLRKFADEKLELIASAAAENFRQCAVDIFMDCPSRERAGWLCDSFFEGRAERILCGESRVEKSFLENFLHEDEYACIPAGMLPMCYPADFYSREYIPQWSLWFILQLREFAERSGERDFVMRFREKVTRLLDYFASFENEDGLLEDLTGWKFIEWSAANGFVDGVNYPTNMLYAAALDSAGGLFGISGYAEKAGRIRKTVRDRSYNGEFFVDNAVRVGGVLQNTGNITEVCQYYAFFFGVATESEYPELYGTLISDFGPQRDARVTYPRVHPAAPFVGYFLRLEILHRAGRKDLLYDNMIGYYLGMAEKTGTLWEHADLRASCCHGFASYVICWLNEMEE